MRVGRANGQDWLRLSEAADALGASLNTVRRWSDSGKLTCYRSPGGHRRYRRRDVDSLLRLQDDAAAGGRALPRPPSSLASLPTQETLRASLAALARVAVDGVGVSTCRFSLAKQPGTAGNLAAFSLSGTGAPQSVVGSPGTVSPAVAEVARTGRRLVISDLAMTSLLTSVEAREQAALGDTAVLALPLAPRRPLTGVMELVETRGPRSFTSANLAFADFMARQVSLLVAAHDDDAPNKLAPLGAEDSSTPSDGDLLLRTLAERLRRQVGAVACDILRYHRNGDALIPVATAPNGSTAALLEPSYPIDSFGAAADTLKTGEPVAIDLAAETRSGLHRVRVDRDGARSLYAVPLRIGNETLGLMELFGFASESQLDRDDVGLIRDSAATAALALSDTPDAALLRRHVSQPDDLLASLGVQSMTGDAQLLARSALRALQQRAGVAACTLYAVTNDTATPFMTGDSPEQPVDDGARWHLDEYPPAATAAASGAPVTAAAVGGECGLTPRETERFLERRGLAGVVLAPLVFWGHLVGLLELGTTDTDEGLRSASQVAEVTADLLAHALGSSGVIARLERRTRNLALIIEAGFEDTARLSTRDVLHSIVKRLSNLTHTPVVDVYSVEGDVLRALVSYDAGDYDREWEGVVLPLRRYPCSLRAVESGEVAVAASLDDPLLAGDGRYSLEKWGYQSQASMPLLSGGRVIGLIELSDYQPRDYADDTELIRGLGQIAAHALENASLFEKIEHRNRILNELVELGSMANRERDLSTLMRRLAERLLVTVDAANCDIYRLGDEGLRCVASFDRSGYDPLAVGTLLTPHEYPTLLGAVSRQQVLVITSPDDPQLSEPERHAYRDYGFASEVSIPLVINDELYGLLDIYDTKERDYTEYLSFLRSAGQIIAGAFENGVLADQFERRSVILREIVDLGAAATQAHDLEQVLATIAERLRQTVDAADCDVFSLQADKLRCLASFDRDGQDTSVLGRTLDLGRFPAAAMAVHRREPVAIASLDDPRLTPEERDDMREYGFQSELCVPLIGAGERVIGIIDMFDTRVRDYGEYLEFLRSVGQTAAGAIENVQLLSELEHRNKALSELVKLGEMGAEPGGLDDLLHAIGPRIVEVMRASGCRVYTLHDRILHCVLSYRNGEFDENSTGQSLDLDLLPNAQASIEARAAIVIEAPDDPLLGDRERELLTPSGSHSQISVPLAIDERVVGLLQIQDHRRQDYAEHRDILLRVGQMIAAALENAP